ncbi:MAG: Sua5/YciO/YrdC/YwlC family protein, partial [Bacteroidota bacterium]
MKEASIDMMYDQELEEVKQTLKNGGTILFPTDTTWSLGCDATNAKAVAKLLELKEYPTDLSFILLVDSTDTIKKYVKHLHPKIETL